MTDYLNKGMVFPTDYPSVEVAPGQNVVAERLREHESRYRSSICNYDLYRCLIAELTEDVVVPETFLFAIIRADKMIHGEEVPPTPEVRYYVQMLDPVMLPVLQSHLPDVFRAIFPDPFAGAVDEAFAQLAPKAKVKQGGIAAEFQAMLSAAMADR